MCKMKANILRFIFVFQFFCAALLCAQEKEIPLGVLTELSGPFAVNGVDCKAGHESALKAFSENGKVGKYKIVLVYGDSKGEGKTAVTEFNKLVAEKKVFGVLVNRSQAAMPLNPLSKLKKIPLLGVVGHPSFVSENDYAFRVYPSSKYEGPFLAENILKKGFKKIAALGLQDEYLVALQSETLNHFKSKGGEVLIDESVTENELDFISLVSRVTRANPDIIFVNFGVSQSGILIRKLREQGLKQPIISNFWIQKSDVIDAAGKDAIEGTGFVGIASELPKFEKALNEVLPGSKASSVFYACHVATALAIQAIKDSKEDIKDSQSFYKALSRASELQLLDEKLPIIQREISFHLEFSNIIGGKVVPERG